MNSEIIKDKFGNQSMWSDPKWSGAWDKFKEEQTSEIDDTNKPWRYDIPMNELDLNDKIVHSPNFKYKGSSHEVYMRKAPLQRIGELRKNFSSVSLAHGPPVWLIALLAIAPKSRAAKNAAEADNVSLPPGPPGHRILFPQNGFNTYDTVDPYLF